MSDDDQELGITESKSHNTGEWYAEVVQKAGLADYGPEGMSGFIVTRPRAYAVWGATAGLSRREVQRHRSPERVLPLFIPESYLEREKDIVEGFDPEVAWVTEAGNKELEERLAVRPTSESIITPYISQWVRSHRDLPLRVRVNQWCSVVRWEATETKPFFRTKEFLWQEGHTAHATHEGAWEETMTRLDQYASVYEDLLAMPVLKGQKPDHDKFPGAETTTTVEALMPDGKSVQAGTSHHLGQSFAEAFDITFSDEDEEERIAHTTSWGLSWRALGALIMTHSDEQGLVLPPGVAPEQVVVVPIWQEDTKDEVLEYAEGVADDLDDAGIRVELDDRDGRNPGFKFNEHELNGVPLRIEIGPHEVEDGELTLVHRPDGESVVEDREGVVATVQDHFDEVYAKLYATAEETLDGAVREADDRADILGTLGQHGGYVTAPWCGDEACEEPIKEPMAAEIVMVPFEDDDPLAEADHGETCAICDDDAERTAYFAKSY